MTLKEKLARLKQENKAILATNFYNYETLRAVVTAAKKLNEPLILQLSESSIHYMGMETAVAMARAMIEKEEVEAWIHLDHGKDPDIAFACMDAGFDSVMIDGSKLPFEENVRVTTAVVEKAASREICVEAELGYVAKLGEVQRMEYTSPEDARRFVELTGVDALAIAIGSAHGFYQETPNLAIDVLDGIREATRAALVLHGSSGIPHSQIREAIRHGINKVNLATEIKNLFMGELSSLLKNTGEIDLRIVFPPAIEAVAGLVEDKLKLIRE